REQVQQLIWYYIGDPPSPVTMNSVFELPLAGSHPLGSAHTLAGWFLDRCLASPKPDLFIRLSLLSMPEGWPWKFTTWSDSCSRMRRCGRRRSWTNSGCRPKNGRLSIVSSYAQHLRTNPIAKPKDRALRERVNVLQHPNGDPMRLGFRNNFVVTGSESRLSYLTDTPDGSSGPPICDDAWFVAALHRAWTTITGAPLTVWGKAISPET